MAICASSVPTTRRLWQSWATVVAIAHFSPEAEAVHQADLDRAAAAMPVEVGELRNIPSDIRLHLAALHAHLHDEVFRRSLVFLDADDVCRGFGLEPFRIEPEVAGGHRPGEVHRLL